jgi:hypothetical protein
MAGVMTDQRETFQRVSVAEAAGILGVSVATVRRRIRAGALTAETVIRPQGSAFMVRLPMDASAGVSDAYDTDQEPRVATRTQASTPDAMVALIQTTIATVLGPLVGQLDAQRQTIERQADTMRSQAETIGTLRAELAAAMAAHSPPASNLTPPARLGELRPWLLLAAILLAAGVVGWLR